MNKLKKKKRNMTKCTKNYKLNKITKKLKSPSWRTT